MKFGGESRFSLDTNIFRSIFTQVSRFFSSRFMLRFIFHQKRALQKMKSRLWKRFNNAIQFSLP